MEERSGEEMLGEDREGILNRLAENDDVIHGQVIWRFSNGNSFSRGLCWSLTGGSLEVILHEVTPIQKLN